MDTRRNTIGVGVGAVIVNSCDEVLLLQRKRKPERGCWSIPGGKVRFGERLEDAVLRELKEELSIEVKVVGLLRVTDHILEDEEAHWVSPAFLVKTISGMPKNAEPHNHSDMRWFPVNSLPLNITMTTRLALAAYREGLPKG